MRPAGRLVALALASLASCGGPTRLERVPPGTWGGEHALLRVEDAGAEAEFDCGHGRLESALRLDGRGRFNVEGFYVREGGPARELPPRHPAVYGGWTDGRRLTFSLTLTEENRTIGPFNVFLGQSARLLKCL